MARALYEQQKDRPTNEKEGLQWAKRKGWENLASECVLDEKDLDFLLKRLEKSGLIKEVVGLYVGYEGGVYVITETFRKLMGYLEEHTP